MACLITNNQPHIAQYICTRYIMKWTCDNVWYDILYIQ